MLYEALWVQLYSQVLKTFISVIELWHSFEVHLLLDVAPKCNCVTHQKIIIYKGGGIKITERNEKSKSISNRSTVKLNFSQVKILTMVTNLPTQYVCNSLLNTYGLLLPDCLHTCTYLIDNCLCGYNLAM